MISAVVVKPAPAKKGKRAAPKKTVRPGDRRSTRAQPQEKVRPAQNKRDEKREQKKPADKLKIIVPAKKLPKSKPTTNASATIPVTVAPAPPPAAAFVVPALVPPAPIQVVTPARVLEPDFLMEQRYREWCAVHVPAAVPAVPLPPPLPAGRSLQDLAMHLASQNINILKMMLLANIN